MRMKKIFAGSLMTAVLLSCVALAQSNPTRLKGITEIKTEGQLEEWITYYYLHPRPELFVSSIRYLSSQKLLLKPNDGFTGFYSQVLLRNPEKIESWTAAVASGSEDQQIFMATNLWAANNEQSRAALKSLSARSKSAEQYVKELGVDTPPRVLLTPLNSPGVLDALWGGFFATGDEQYVKRIIAALPLLNTKGDTKKALVGSAARWSLTSNAQQHPRVMAICERELDNQSIADRPLLAQVIEGAKKK